MPTVNMLEAKSTLSKLVEKVETGAEKEIIIARNGKPAARLVPLGEEGARRVRLGLQKGKFPDMSLDDFDADNEAVAKLFLEGE
jgi:prevent-host-death family protein